MVRRRVSKHKDYLLKSGRYELSVSWEGSFPAEKYFVINEWLDGGKTLKPIEKFKSREEAISRFEAAYQKC